MASAPWDACLGTAVEEAGGTDERDPCRFQKSDFDFDNKRVLGRGGFANVYLVRQRSTDSKVVIKVPKAPDFDEVMGQDILREVETMMRIQMPYIARVYGLLVNGDRYCGFVMEHVALGSIDQIVLKLGHKLPWSLQVRVMHQTAEAMKHLHANMILHLDLKPPNILMDDECNVKLTDFGLSTIRESVSTNNDAPDTHIGGTRYFQPPEVLSKPHRQPSRKIDVYAFAITMWQILTGECPFKYCRDYYLLTQRIIKDGVRPDLTLVLAYTQQEKQITHIMQECWHQDRHRRPLFEDIAAALRPLSGEIANSACLDANALKAILMPSGPAITASVHTTEIKEKAMKVTLAEEETEGADREEKDVQACQCEGACNCHLNPQRLPGSVDDTLPGINRLSLDVHSPPKHSPQHPEARHPPPDRGIPVQTTDHSAASAWLDLQVQQGREMAATLIPHTRGQIIDAAETNPQPDSIVVTVEANDNTRVTQDESRRFAREVFQRFEDRKVLAMVEQVFHDATLDVVSVRWGCMEFIFENPLSADAAQTLLSSLPEIQYRLTELLLEQEKDKYHLEVSLADEVRKLASTTKHTPVTMTKSITGVFDKFAGAAVTLGDCGEVGLSYKMMYLDHPDLYFFNIYQHVGQGTVTLVGVGVIKAPSMHRFGTKLLIYRGSMYSKDTDCIIKYSLNDLRMVKRIRLAREIDVIGVMDSNTIMARRHGVRNSPLCLLDEDGRVVNEIPTAPSDGYPLSTCEVGDYIIVLYLNRTNETQTLKGFKKLDMCQRLATVDEDFTIVIAGRRAYPRQQIISAYGKNHILVMDAYNTLAIYQIPSGDKVKHITLGKDLKIERPRLYGFRYYHEYDDHGILYVAYGYHVRTQTLHVFKVSDFLGSPSFELLGKKKFSHEEEVTGVPKRDKASDVLGSPSFELLRKKKLSHKEEDKGDSSPDEATSESEDSSS